MALKAILESLEGLPEAVAALYVEKNGKFHLDVEGYRPKSEFDEFRNNNITLQQEKSDLEKRLAAFDGFDPEEAAKIREQAAKLADKQLIDAGKVDELVQLKVAEAVEKKDRDIVELQGKYDEVSGNYDTAQGSIRKMNLERALAAHAEKNGVRKGAYEDVYAHAAAYGVHVNEEGALAINTEEGTQRYSISKPTQAMSVDEYFKDVLMDVKPFYFEDSTGGGSSGGGQGGGRRISSTDSAAVNGSLEAIASGKTTVAL